MLTTSLPLTTDRIQARLLVLAGVFLGLYSLALSLSPAARTRTWDADLLWRHWLGLFVWIGLFFLAHRLTRQFLPDRDPFLLPVAALLSGWGLLSIWRLFPVFGLRQTAWLAISIGVVVLGLRLPNHLTFLRRYKYLWLTSGLVLTALTLLLGTNPATGASPRLWLGCCGIYFQPSEPLKLLLVVYLAAYFADRQPLFSLAASERPAPGEHPDRVASLLPLLAPTLVMTGLTLLLLLAQRDLGTASIFIFLFAAMVFVATRSWLILLISALSLALAGGMGYFLFDVVRLRVDAWLNPWLDPTGGSYQIVQSLLAVASGGLAGRGPGLGNPNVVPVPHSDFIFAAIAEESGLVGVIGLIALFVLLGARSLRIALCASDNYRRYLAAGLSAYLIGQSVLIAGGNLRLLPLTGVTLPFVSYGGSSLLTAFLSTLLLLHISQSAGSKPALIPNVRPYFFLAGFLFSGLIAIALASGWWAYYRGPALVERTDNPRRVIADRFVRRGALLARDNTPLAQSVGNPGEYTRQTTYPDLGLVLGYTHPGYGQSGLEASLDPYLRGLRGNPGLMVWWNHLLYGQPPPGLDVRLSLDLNLQRTADDLLRQHTGAIVLLNAQSGEILALASQPGFDPNQLDEKWAELISDPRAPLLNRATQGRYPAGTALGPLLLAAASEQGNLPPLPAPLDERTAAVHWPCAEEPEEPTWKTAIAGGCPAPQAALGAFLGAEQVLEVYEDLGLFSAPDIRLPTENVPAPGAFQDAHQAYLGLGEVSASPLQMALAASTLSTGGVRPAPQLALAVRTSTGDWAVLPLLGRSEQVFQESATDSTAETLAVDGSPIWQSLAHVPGDAQSYTWYLAGTLPRWSGAPLTLVILLEDGTIAQAEAMGQAMIQAALQPR